MTDNSYKKRVENYESKKNGLIDLHNSCENQIIKSEIEKQLQELIKNQPIIDTDEIKAPKSILLKPDLLDIYTDEASKLIVGEKETIQTLLLITIGGILTLNAESTSTNLMVNDEAGAGKDYCVKSVLKLLPPHKVVIRKRITETAFTYWHNAKFEPDWSWDNKIFFNEDISNSVLNSSVFKVMSSTEICGEMTSTVVVNQKAQDVIIKGKPVMIITTATANPNQELLRRYPILNLDTSEDQTKAILKRKADFHKKGLKPKYSDIIKDSISLLDTVLIKVPYADQLVDVLNTKHVIIRTHFDRLIDYIKFSTAIHQKQRQTDKDGYLLATPKDYENGRIALIKTTSNIFSIPITKLQRKILDILKNKEKDTGYSVSDLEADITFCSERTLRTELDKLTEIGFLKKDKQYRDKTPKPVFIYIYQDDFKITIPSYQDILNIANTSITSNTSLSSNTSNTELNINKKGVNEVIEVFEVESGTPKISYEVIKDD